MLVILRTSSNGLKLTIPVVQNTRAMINHGNWLCSWDLQISSRQLLLKSTLNQGRDQHSLKKDFGNAMFQKC